MDEIDLSHLNEDSIDSLVFSGIDFVLAVTETFGPEHGIKVWDAMAGAVGEDLRGRIFFSMLSGDASGNVTLLPWPQMDKKVEYIKAIRAATGLGLKEAKDISDEVQCGNSKRIKVPLKEKGNFVKALRAMGARIL